MALTTRNAQPLLPRRRPRGAVALPAADALAAERKHRSRPLWRAHAHNDYAEHPRPLLDALDHRFGSVEADIYLVGDQLLVAHDPVDLDPARTLESLYLDPLAARVRANHGSVYLGCREPLQRSDPHQDGGCVDPPSYSTVICGTTSTCSPPTPTAGCARARSRLSSPATQRPVPRWRPRPSAGPSTTAGSPTSAVRRPPRSFR
ncbi:hypothetical protein SALBM311S_00169 [Streptomyces alboniger]